MENTNNSKVFTKVTVLVFLIGIVVGFGSASLWLRRSKNVSAVKETAPALSEEVPAGGPSTDKTAENTTNTSLAQVSATLSGAKDSVSAVDQPAGNTVNVSSLALEKDGWVAIHEDNGGNPGKILGAQLFTAGKHDAGTVDLLRATTAGGVYYAMLHIDDGDHKFDPAKDMPVSGADANPVMAKFMAK